MKGQTIHAARAVAVWSLRGAAVALLAGGAYLLVKKLAFGIGTGSLASIGDYYDGVGEGHGTYRGLALIAVGVAVGLCSRLIARWIVVLPATGCAKCGYELGSPAPAKCPECGYPAVGA